MDLTVSTLLKDSLSSTAKLGKTTGLVIFAIYFALSFLGDLFLVHGSTASPFWPAAGVGLIATIIFGKSALVPIFFG